MLLELLELDNTRKLVLVCVCVYECCCDFNRLLSFLLNSIQGSWVRLPPASFSLTTTPLSLSVESTEDESFQNFKEWCNSLALKYSGDCVGKRVYGLYHQMKEGDHDDFERKLCDVGSIV